MSAGRITVEKSPTGQAIGLALAHWELTNVAILTLDEARELIYQLQEALKGPDVDRQQRSTAPSPAPSADQGDAG